MRAVARNCGRDPDAVTGAMYLTLAIDDVAVRAEARLNGFLERYYGQPAAVLRSRQACFAGSLVDARAWLAAYERAWVQHLVLRFAGDPERHLEMLAKV